MIQPGRGFKLSKAPTKKIPRNATRDRKAKKTFEAVRRTGKKGQVKPFREEAAFPEEIKGPCALVLTETKAGNLKKESVHVTDLKKGRG